MRMMTVDGGECTNGNGGGGGGKQADDDAAADHPQSVISDGAVCSLLRASKSCLSHLSASSGGFPILLFVCAIFMPLVMK